MCIFAVASHVNVQQRETGDQLNRDGCGHKGTHEVVRGRPFAKYSSSE